MTTRLSVGFLASVILVVLSLGAASLAPPAHAQPQVVGQWSTLPYLSPINPIHVGLMRTGKVLIVAGSENNQDNTTYKAAVWNPATGTFTVQTTPWDLFCNGMSLLPDGRVFMTGGNTGYDPFFGPPWTTIFDPATEKFVQMEDMAKGRWYPTNAGLMDGGQMTFSGLDEQGFPNDTVEIYDVGGGWTPPYKAPWSPQWYPRLHLLGNGKVFLAGPEGASRTFDPSQGTWSNIVAQQNYPDGRMYGSSVLLPLKPDEGYHPYVIVMGGNTSEATATVEHIDLGVWPESWRMLPPMSAPRVNMNAVLLPNGKILALGGSKYFSEVSSAALNAEIFDPVTETWSPAGTMAFPRMYHSSALLLPDATVWVAGSNPNRSTWEPKMEIYKPPYLFTSTGAAAPRPVIGTIPSVIGYAPSAPNFTVNTSQAANISQVILVRPGANTHGFDSEQRIVHMWFTKGSNKLTVTPPHSKGAAPPGYYMLFLIDNKGVPSVAKFIQLAEHPTNKTPTAKITSPSGPVTIQAGQSVTFAGSATDPDGSVALYSWVFPGGSPKTSKSATPGPVSFAVPGTYVVSLVALDNLGVNDPSPPTVTVTVTGGGSTPPLTASITSPGSGATVSGTVTVGMAAGSPSGSPTNFTLKLDNGATLSSQNVTSGSTASYTWNTTTATNGPHTLNLTVTDGAGRTATAAVNVTVSNGGGGGGGGTGPTVSITTPPNGAWIGSGVRVGVTASDPSGLTSIKVWGAGAAFATVPCSGTTCTEPDLWFDTTGKPDGAYELNAVATNTAGASTISSKVTVFKEATTPVFPSGATATTAPPLTASITSPGDGTTITGSVTVNMSASNASGSPTSFVLKLDNGATLSSQNVTGSTATYTWNSTTATNGSHSLNLTVTDAAGRTATSATAIVVNNAGAPPPLGASITSPGGGATVSGPVTVNMSASNASGSPTSFVLKLDNGATLSSQNVTGSTATYTWNSTTATNGNHNLNLTVTDAAGRTATSAVAIVVSNASAPPPLGAAITAPSDGATVSGNVTVNMSATNASGSPTTYTLKLDNATTLSTQNGGSTAAYTWNSATVSNGNHTLNLTVTDGAGRTATSAIGVVVSNASTPPPGGGDTTPPTVTITTPPSGAWISDGVRVGVTASDNAGLATIKVWGAGAVFETVTCTGTTCTAPDLWFDTTGKPNGAYEITAVAMDAAGNQAFSATIKVNKDATSPVYPSGATASTTPPPLSASITSPASGATVSGTVTVNMAAGNASGSPTSFVLKLDNGATLSSQSVASGSTATYAWNTTTASNGAHTLNLTVTDSIGRTASSGVLVTVSNTAAPPPPPPGGGGDAAPSVSITTPTTGSWMGDVIKIGVTASDSVGLVNIKVWGAGSNFDTVACSGTTCTGEVWLDTSGKPNGAYEVNAVAVDTAGNQTKSATIKLNKEATSPVYPSGAP